MSSDSWLHVLNGNESFLASSPLITNQSQNTKNYSNMTNRTIVLSSMEQDDYGYYYEYRDMELTTYQRIVDGMNIYLTPMIIVVGLTGNLISFIVFMFTHLCRLSSNIYLAALAVADTGFLLSLLIGWLSWANVELFHRNGWCQIVIYMTFVCSFLSIWYVVSFTVERYIVVFHPLKRHRMCTTRRAKCVVIGLAAFALVAYSYGTWTSGIILQHDTFTCTPYHKYQHIIAILSYVDTCISLIIPFSIICVLNVCIFLAIIKVFKQRKRMSFTEVESKSSAGNSRRISFTDMDSKSNTTCNNRLLRQSFLRHKHPTRVNMKVTKLLLIVSSVYLILNLPNHVIRSYVLLAHVFGIHFDTETYLNLNKWQGPCQFLYYIHFSINFFLYNFCGKNFRKALSRLCRKLRYRIMRLFTTKTSSENDLQCRKIFEESSDRVHHIKEVENLFGMN